MAGADNKNFMASYNQSGTFSPNFSDLQVRPAVTGGDPIKDINDVMALMDSSYQRGRERSKEKDKDALEKDKMATEKAKMASERNDLSDKELIRPVTRDLNQKSLADQLAGFTFKENNRGTMEQIEKDKLEREKNDPYQLEHNLLETANHLGVPVGTNPDGKPNFEKLRTDVSKAQQIQQQILQRKAQAEGLKTDTVEVDDGKGGKEKRSVTVDPLTGKVISSVLLGVAGTEAPDADWTSAYNVLVKAGKPQLAFDDTGKRKPASEVAKIVSEIQTKPAGKLVASQIKSMEDTENARNDLQSVKAAYDKLKTTHPKLVGPIAGRTAGMIRGQYVPEFADLQGRITSAVPKLARGVFGEVGVLTDADVNRYKQLLPTASTDPEVAEQLFKSLEKKLNEAARVKLEALEKSGVDMTRYKSWGVHSAPAQETPAAPLPSTELIEGATYDIPGKGKRVYVGKNAQGISTWELPTDK